jgi:gamma-glutamylcyclotransferase (GGCT)/AIG2-like uncharacterized protein YtfP
MSDCFSDCPTAPPGPVAPSLASPVRIFVYGTLKPGERYHQPYCDGKIVAAEPAIARGKLYHLLEVGYPALAMGDEIVQGVVLSLADSNWLGQLDDLEDYDPQAPAQLNLYERQEADIFAPDGQPWGRAWLYRMAPEKIVQLKGIHLPGGSWSSSLAAQLTQSA